MEAIMRNLFLTMAKSQTANRLAKRYGLRFGAQRFVAGESIQHAVETTKRLNEQGLKVTLDHLGESVYTRDEAAQAAADCIRTLDAISEAEQNMYLSIKLTQLGLDIDEGLCLDHVKKIVSRAAESGYFVRIDMEDYAHNEATFRLFHKLHADFPNQIGLAIQACLHKSKQDIAELGKKGVNVRLVKGAYKESPEVAFPDKADVDKQFIDLLEMHLTSGGFTAIATHDETVITHIKQFVTEQDIPKERYEFQMLYGIRTQLQLDLVKEGYPVRVYVPFGTDWYAYFMRRLAERPANVNFVLRSMFKK
ncbi:proline dehydrogenase family protein [Desmospora profundinema]|uniref:proline dehydrogenase n=1 Tax=Desmospora profundinema TaxID=1571184 RepID=A0ABU1III0_9BACL|nr:proline dehydrogenase family protein [Desmospora profundinema]MDR6224347.1 proline dehydrogenase [Desmospora profundinema]